MIDKRQTSRYKSFDAAALRERAEEQVRNTRPSVQSAQAPEEIQRVLHELQVHQIELEMQNEELRRAQAEIEAGRARYFDLYDLAPVGYCTLSKQGLILEANLAAANLLGRVRGALARKPISRFILKDDQDIYYLHHKKLVKTGETQKCELRLVKADGELFWAHLTADATKSEDGAPLCRIVISDINERKEWERKLVLSEERLRLAQLSANIGAWELDLHTGEFFSTPELPRMYGEDENTFIDYHDLHRKVHPDDLARVKMQRDEAVNAKQSFDLEFRVNYSNDEVRWISEKGGAIYDERGEVSRLFGMNADISTRKQAEAVLRRDKDTLQRIVEERSKKLLETQVELEQAKRLSDIGTLASTVAHELRNPLAAIAISAAIIRRSARGDDKATVGVKLLDIDNMVSESDQIINNLLFYSHLRPPRRESIPLHEFIGECVEYMSEQFSVKISFPKGSGSPKYLKIYADPTQIREVLHNILHNAIDALEDEHGKVDAWVNDCAGFVNIHIRDNGHGIECQYVDNIFDPFFTTKAKGTGLGLTVSNQIVKMHGGTIDVSSEIGKGSTFTISIPKNDAALSAAVSGDD